MSAKRKTRRRLVEIEIELRRRGLPLDYCRLWRETWRPRTQWDGRHDGVIPHDGLARRAWVFAGPAPLTTLLREGGAFVSQMPVWRGAFRNAIGGEQ